MEEIPYHILKLNNGEEVITKIVESDSENLLIETPMVFKSFLTQDKFMRPKEVVIIKNWSLFTEDKYLSIPRSSIMMINFAGKDAILMYENEKERQNKQISLNKFKQEMEDEIEKMISDHLDDTPQPTDISQEDEEEFKKMMELLSDNTQKIKDIADKTNPNDKQNNKKEEMVFMNMMFPPDIIIDLVESGAIDPELFGEMYMDIKSKMKQSPKKKAKKKPTSKKPNKKISDEYTGDQKNHKDFGNRWTDWNPDLSSEDYK